MNEQKISLQNELQNVFLDEKYHIQQPYIQITREGYDITSENSQETYSAVRPRRIFRNIISRLAAILAFFVVFVAVVSVLGLAEAAKSEKSSLLALVFVIVSFLLSSVAYVVVAKAIAPKRILTLHKKGDVDKVLIKILPSSGLFIFNHEYLIQDQNGKTLASFSKKYLESIFRKRWHCHDPESKYLFTAIEDSLFMALLRRYLGLGRLIPLHFSFEKNGGKSFGTFRRRFSLRDKYKLDYSPQAVDGWLIVAAALLLDTGEER